MFTPKEIAHPLRTMKLMVDETIVMSEKENKLLDNFKKIHNTQYELEQEIQKFHEFFSEHKKLYLTVQNEFLGIEKQMHQFPVTKLKLQAPYADYKAFREEYDAFMAEAMAYNTHYHKFYEKFQQLSADINELTKKPAQLNAMSDKTDKQIVEIESLQNEVFDDPKMKALDWNAFDNDYQAFLGCVDQSSSELLKIDNSIYEYENNDYNPLIRRYNEGIAKMREFNKTYEKLYKAYLYYTKAKEKDFIITYIEWKDKESYKNYEDYVDYGVSYDTEYGPKGGLILHLDTQLIVEDILNLAIRNSYRMKCTLKETFTKEVMEPLIGNCIERMKNEVRENIAKKKRDFNIDMIGTPYHITEELTKTFIEGVSSDKDFGIINDDAYKTAITFTSPQQVQLVGVTTLNIMNQLFFINRKFNNRQMRHAFDKVVSMGQYLTLLGLLPEIDKGPVTLNFRQYILFLILMDCACQLLLGDHEEDFIEGLEQVKVNAGLRKEFMKAAQANVKGAMEDFKKNRSKITPLENLHDWNRIFFGG